MINQRRNEDLESIVLVENQISNTRARVQSQNIKKRNQMSRAANGMYYEMRKPTAANGFDLAQVMSD